MVVTSPKELVEALESMDDEEFAKHVNDTKHEIADWLENLNASVSDEIKTKKKKEDVIKLINDNLDKFD